MPEGGCGACLRQTGTPSGLEWFSAAGGGSRLTGERGWTGLHLMRKGLLARDGLSEGEVKTEQKKHDLETSLLVLSGLL